MVAAPGMPPEWAEVTSKAQQVEKLNPGVIQNVADQFDRASKDSADHAAALRSATAVLGGGTWSGPAADAFFDYVKRIGDAGQKVNEHLDEVSRELADLQVALADIKGKIHTIQDDAKKQIDSANDQAVAQANAAEAQERAVHDGHPDAVMPNPTSSEIMATNAKNTSAIASGARDRVQGLLNSANEQINRVMGLVKQEVEGGYSTVQPLGTTPASASSTGGIHSGAHHSFSGGGGGGGGSFDAGSGGPPATQPPGNVQQWIEEAIKELQAAGVPVTEADVKNIWAIIQHESGGNPNAINLWDCVPLSTMILTRRGWLKHDEVQVGDQTIGYNSTTGKSEWTRITRVVHHYDAPLVRLENSRWHATTTPNHRWLTLPRKHVTGERCPLCAWPAGTRRRGRSTNGGLRIHLSKVHGVKAQRQQSETATEPAFVGTGDIHSRDRLLLAAPAEADARLDITVNEAAIIGWIARDGHVEIRRHRPTISLAQSKPAMVDKLKRLLEDIPHAVHVDDRGECGPRHQFRLGRDYAQDLVRRAGNPTTHAVEQVLSMSAEQQKAWLDAVIDAEGSQKSGYPVIYQAPGAVLEAITLAVYLSGRRPRVLYSQRSGDHGWAPEAVVHPDNPIITGAFLKQVDAGRGDVWCVTTTLGTWTAREEDHVFLTGNSNAKAGHPSKGLMQCIDSTFNAHKLPGHNDIYNPVDNIIAGVRYTMSRYGSIANTPGLQAMSHGGGYVGY